MTSPALIIEYILLSFAAIGDMKSRKINNALIILLMFNSLFSHFDILQRMAAFLFPCIFMFPFAMKFPSLKGGDIKFISAIGAFFGLYRLSIILLISVIFGHIYCLIKKEKSFPLAFITLLSVIFIKFTEVFLL